MKTIKHFYLAMILVLFTIQVNHAQNVGDTAPDFSFNDLDGNTFTLSEQEGKVVFIFLFGNSCPSCLSVGNKTETEIYQVFNENPDFVAVGLDVWDGSSNTVSVSSFKEQTGITFPLLIKAGSVLSEYGSTYDRLLVVDKEGILRHKGTTYVSNDIDNAKSVIQEYLTVMTSSSGLLANTKVKVYPNPASTFIRVSFENGQAQHLTFKIYQPDGKIIQKQNMQVSKGTQDILLDISDFGQGIYFLGIDDGSRPIYHSRFIKN